MLNVNIGGTKGWAKLPEEVRRKWKVLDIAGHPDYRYDLNSGTFLPFVNNTVDNYYCSHTLEHVKPELVTFLLEQVHSTLKNGGLFRIVVPDVLMAAKKYVAGDRRWLSSNNSAHAPFFPDTALGDFMTWFYSHVKNQGHTARSGHNMAFDKETLTFYLKQFRNIRSLAYNKCSPIFKNLDFPRYKDISLYMEAQK